MVTTRSAKKTKPPAAIARSTSTRTDSAEMAVLVSTAGSDAVMGMAGNSNLPRTHLKRTDSRLSHKTPQIQVGILPSNGQQNVESIASSIKGVAPDRLNVIIFGSNDESPWPEVDVLVLSSSHQDVSERTLQYLEATCEDSPNPSLVLSDCNVDYITSDRRIFYDLCDSYRNPRLADKLPVRAYANREGDSSSTVVRVRREHIEINGKIILKPCMERPADASSNESDRILYPGSSGGGCKYQDTGRYVADDNNVRLDDSYIYEELVDTEDAAKKIVDQRRYRKRDRVLDAAYRVMPRLERGREIPRYDDDDDITFDSDLTRSDRKVFVVTTASLPWMTGTAVNPLLRAAYLTRGRPKGSVTLVIPWLTNEDDRKKLYAKYDFKTPLDQEAHVREWLRDKAGMPQEADPLTGIQILWYDSRYHPTFMSIFSTCDICKLIPEDSADVCVLEEPEHLNWFRAEGEQWTKKFVFTVGIVHTNYKAYAGAQVGGILAAPIIAEMSSLMVRAYCNKVIKLSPVLQTFSPEKEIVCNVHGVRGDFVAEGERRATDANNGIIEREIDGTRAYFVGKILWAKGLDKLMSLEHFYRKMTGSYFAIDIVGDGPELEEIRRAYLGRSTANKQRISYERANSTFDLDFPKSIREFRRTPIPATFLGRREHYEHAHGNKYKIFINPSVTEVLCTTTAEALSMGKFAIIPAHPSNSFFLQFPNCLSYQNKLEFAANLRWALENEPEPLSPELSHQFTWEAATDRFIASSAITMREERIRAKARKSKIDNRIAEFHQAISKGKRGDVVRTIVGAGPVAQQSGKWGPYLEDVKQRTYDFVDDVIFLVQENMWKFSLVLLSLILYSVWSTNVLPAAFAGSEL